MKRWRELAWGVLTGIILGPWAALVGAVIVKLLS
jgi:hypothetical protein